MSPKEPSRRKLLSKLGADNDFLFEVVVSTCAIDGTPNAAPMGIQFVGEGSKGVEKMILIKPFKSTTTHHNLSTQREAVINVSSDPAVFYETAFKRQGERGGRLHATFGAAKTVKPPRVKGCDAYIEVSVVDVGDASHLEKDRSEVLCQVKSVQIQNPGAKLYCRAPHVLIEAMIHATRVRELASQELVGEANELMNLIDRYRKLIHRVAPSSQYEAMAEELAPTTGVGKEGTISSTEKDEGEA